MMKNRLLNRKKINPREPVYTGEKQVDRVEAQLYRYHSSENREDSQYDLSRFSPFMKDGFRNWLNIHGLHETETIKDVCLQLGVHDLTIQDILDVNQRPKVQEFDNYWFFTLKSITPTEDDSIETEQLSFLLGEDFLVSFQERRADYFNHIRERLNKDIGIVRERGTDYLLYLLLESILDNYFKTLNQMEKRIGDLQIINPGNTLSPRIIDSIEQYKSQVHQIKKTIIPIKEFISRFEREKLRFTEERTVKYFYELKDLCFTVIDDCEYIEVKLESSSNLFFSVQGFRMNQVMKMLTMVATIFIPLTFIAGIYGMNFVHMPELQWKWGYYGVWGLMVLIFAGMVIYFKRKKWF